MKTVWMGPLPKITLWMRIKRMWCQHKNTFEQYNMAYINKEDEFPFAPVVYFWQCHNCGVSWGEFQTDIPAWKIVAGPEEVNDSVIFRRK